MAGRVDKCICGKHMIEAANEGTCMWCGHGDVKPVVELAYARNMAQTVSAVFGHMPVDNVVPLPVRQRRPALHPLWDEDACAHAALAEQQRTGHFPSSTSWQKACEHGQHRPAYATVIARFGSWHAFKTYCADIPRDAIAA